jgi:hypothetical protein
MGLALPLVVARVDKLDRAIGHPEFRLSLARQGCCTMVYVVPLELFEMAASGKIGVMVHAGFVVGRGVTEVA